MSGDKGLNPHELAHKWVKDLGTARYSHKSGTEVLRYANSGVIVGVCSTEQFTDIIAWSILLRKNKEKNSLLLLRAVGILLPQNKEDL